MGGYDRRHHAYCRPPALSQADRSARQGQAHRRSTGGLPISHRYLEGCEQHLSPGADHQRLEPGNAWVRRRERRIERRCLRADPRRYPDRANLFLDRAQCDEMGADPQRRADGGGYAPMPVPYSNEARMIPGFKEGILAMSTIGDKGTFFIPAALGYGERGGGPIPPNADLIFEVEFKEIAVTPKQGQAPQK